MRLIDKRVWYYKNKLSKSKSKANPQPVTKEHVCFSFFNTIKPSEESFCRSCSSLKKDTSSLKEENQIFSPINLKLSSSQNQTLELNNKLSSTTELKIKFNPELQISSLLETEYENMSNELAMSENGNSLSKKEQQFDYPEIYKRKELVKKEILTHLCRSSNEDVRSCSLVSNAGKSSEIKDKILSKVTRQLRLNSQPIYRNKSVSTLHKKGEDIKSMKRNINKSFKELSDFCNSNILISADL